MNTGAIEGVMRRIAAASISLDAAADAIGCSVRTVQRLMVKNGVMRPPSPIHERRRRHFARCELLTTAAKAVIAGKRTTAEAAEIAECSERTVLRWVKKLSEIEGKPLQKRRKSLKIRPKSAK